MPRITGLLNTLWLPHLENFGDLDWNLPVEPVAGNNTRQQINATLLDYFAVKGQEGRAQAEQRKWRANFVTRYLFNERGGCAVSPLMVPCAGRTVMRKGTHC